LVGLFRQMPGVAEVIEIGEPLPPYDFQVYERTLPHLFQSAVTGIPCEAYVHPDPARVSVWRDLLPPRDGRLRVGLVWAGDPVNPNDVRRSIMELDTLKPVLAVPGVQFVSLQHGERAADLSHRDDVVAAGPMLVGFRELAACMANMDLVISVDTSAANLAGAMGLPVWVLLALSGEFRWGPTGETMRSPWYKSARLVRQVEDGGWDTVMTDVVTALKAHLQTLADPLNFPEQVPQ
jgi:hypothetical protein